MKKELIPEVKIIQMEDPTFEGGSTRTAIAEITNNAAVELTYQLELYLNATKVASSGIVNTTIQGRATVNVQFTLVMPIQEGTYNVYLDVSHEDELILHGQASEQVIITVTPSVTIGNITWS